MDTELLWSQTFQAADGLQLCGSGSGGWHEDIYHFEQTISHSAATLVVRVTTTLDSGASPAKPEIARTC